MTMTCYLLQAGTASPEHHDFLTKELGADEAIDYRKPDWEEAYKDNDKKFDIVIDPMGVRGETPHRKRLCCLKLCALCRAGPCFCLP